MRVAAIVFVVGAMLIVALVVIGLLTVFTRWP
jgi:hypothetical protein